MGWGFFPHKFFSGFLERTESMYFKKEEKSGCNLKAGTIENVCRISVFLLSVI